MKNKIKIALVSLAILSPLVSFAAEYLTGTSAIFLQVAYLVGVTIPIAFILGLLFFFWGVAQYIRSEGSAKQEGRQIMIWGVVALFVMSSVWGLVRFIQTELLPGVDNTAMKIPTITQ